MQRLRFLLPIILASLFLWLGHSVLQADVMPLTGPEPAAPTTDYTVCPMACDYATINEALTVAGAGDTILVLPGIYTETIALKPGVQLHGTPLATTLNGNGNGPVVTADNGAILSDTVFSGFVVRGGVAAQGAGIYIGNGASPLLSGLVVRDNTGDDPDTSQGGGLFVTGGSTAVIRGSSFLSNTAGSGAAVYVDGSPITFYGNTLELNRAQGGDGGAVLLQDSDANLHSNFVVSNWANGSGGGIFAVGGAPWLRQNVIAGNRAQSGGGLSISNSTPQIEHNRIISNVALLGSGGGMAVVGMASAADGASSTDVTLHNNLFVFNRAAGFGAGLFAENSGGLIRNNTLAHNAGLMAVSGEAIYLLGSNSTPIIQNNIIVQNNYGIRGPVGAQVANPVISYNDVWSNSAGDYVGTNIASQAGAPGNISADPLFTTGVLGQFYLSQVAAGQLTDSPAVDAGADTAVSIGLDTRTTRNDDYPDADMVDMGYHFPSISYIMAGLPVGGGLVTLTKEITAVFNFPPNAIPQPITLTAGFTRGLPLPGGMRSVGQLFDVTARDANGDPVTNFAAPFTLTLTYPETAVDGRFIHEASLQLYYYDPLSGSWQAIPSSGFDSTNNQLVVSLDHLTTFALMGNADALPIAASSFRLGGEGWLVAGDAQFAGSMPPDHHLLNGHPLGFVSAEDDVMGNTWYWVAPPTFWGDASAAYGAMLRFDLAQHSSFTNQYDTDDVILVGGPVSDTVTLVYDTAVNPRQRWTVYNLPLQAGAGWQRVVLGSGCDAGGCVPASETDIRTALSEVRQLWIRGEFEDGPDTGGLDNVIFGGQQLATQIVPGEGGSISFLGLVDMLLDFPMGSVTETVTMTLGVLPGLPLAAQPQGVIPLPDGLEMVGEMWQATAVNGAGEPVTTFSHPFTMTLLYGQEDVTAVNEATLGLYYWDEGSATWQLVPATLDTANNRLTAELDHLGTFALFGEAGYTIYLPVVVRP